MKKIYALYSDDMHFQALGTAQEEESLLLSCHPIKPKEIGWNPPELRVFGDDLKRGDFLHSAPDCLIVNAKTLKILRPFFEKSGEILPLFYEGESFFLINILKIYEILNYYEVERNDFGYPSKLRFRTRFRPEPGLFKFRAITGVLVLTDSEHPSENFPDVVQSNGLEGLVFDQIWSSEEDIEI